MQIGLIGLGRMGAGMARRLVGDGHQVVGFDLSAESSAQARADGATTVDSVAELVAALTAPRVVWLMLPPGQPTQDGIDATLPLLDEGDLLIDGGNSDFRDAPARAAQATDRGVGFMDIGVSGGQWGWKNGYGLMAGGSTEDYSRIEPVLTSLAAPGGASRVGSVGAGHRVKAVHNAVQYGVMQAYADGFALLDAAEDVDTLEALRAWQGGSSVRSWLLEQILAAYEENPTLEDVSARVTDSGMGRWTAEEAIRLGIATPVLTAALHARFTSQDDTHLGSRLLSAARHQIGGHK